ncbi:LytR/AlgR family response regulator transcription factor [Mucilaginibacter pocheonensis]|uniref:DNA-binding LytR/AlgR family response regulator n=1 Tax=Mucilaginibacter pocheonensis TaxID=398050 RepID=A0ABU1TCI7_9SPHI|nr:LytTR family DNA-binding domain-containing protein [Mucilaginibacter pocheonensis]MDR6942905.1 DNA-binding LytR/AlgR family response regulator [Mucilaginibacter pocheonensis]
MVKCLIVDDEEPARELIRLHLSDFEGFEVVASLDNGLDAFTFLQKNVIDLVFLDIQMPKISGLELIGALKAGPQFIFTTAFREYAANAYELDVLDYLVKPITRERFMKAVFRYMHKNMQPPPDYQDAYHFFKVGREQVKIFLKDIIFIEGLADYIQVHTVHHAYIASEKLGYMEEKLPEQEFTRIHKSFIIALDKMTSYTAEQVKLGDRSLPLGRLFKGNFLKKVSSKTEKN